ncbi:MAG: hypothetical protein HGA78_04735 [Nitrospirales bacterium]|nr:hypothetical protein [Nitrospirales bacterium]
MCRASIRGWWRYEGRKIYPDATTILITANGGESNGSRFLRKYSSPLKNLYQDDRKTYH